VEEAPGKLHPLLTITALAVTVASLATIGVITGVIPDRSPVASAAPQGAAAAAFATHLASDPLSLNPRPISASPTTAPSSCADCATVVAMSPIENNATRQSAPRWNIEVRMDDGTVQSVQVESQPSWHANERVRLVDGALVSM
jgi:hypothetical protein